MQALWLVPVFFLQLWVFPLPSLPAAPWVDFSAWFLRTSGLTSHATMRRRSASTRVSTDHPLISNRLKQAHFFLFLFSRKKNQRMDVERIITLCNKDPDLDALYFRFPSCLLLKSFEVSSPLTLPHLMLHRHSPNSQIKQCLHHHPEQLCACKLSHSI